MSLRRAYGRLRSGSTLVVLLRWVGLRDVRLFICVILKTIQVNSCGRHVSHITYSTWGGEGGTEHIIMVRVTYF